MHIIINNYNKCNKAKVCQLGNFLNHLWQNKGPKPDFNQYVILLNLKLPPEIKNVPLKI